MILVVISKTVIYATDNFLNKKKQNKKKEIVLHHLPY